MKKIQCIIRPQKLEDVKKALTEFGILGMTVTEVRGYGKQKGFMQHYRASEKLINLLPKIEIEVIVKDSDLEKAVDAIIENARTGEVGDGKIFISEVSQVIRIRTSEKGEKVL